MHSYDVTHRNDTDCDERRKYGNFRVFEIEHTMSQIAFGHGRRETKNQFNRNCGMRGCQVKAAAAVGGRLEEIEEEKTDEKASEAKSLERTRVLTKNYL